MQQWVQNILESGEVGWLMLPASFLLGLLTALGSACNYAVLGAVAGYAASREDKKLVDTALVCMGLMVSVVVVLAVAGALVGSVRGFGSYGAILAGVITIFFGLAALDVLPFRVPKLPVLKGRHRRGLLGGVIFGLAMGGASAGLTVSCCAPLLWVTLGVVAAKGQTGFGALVLTIFAVGFSVPMVAIMFGVSLGKLSGKGQKWFRLLRVVAGVFLIAVGFWFLAGI